MKTFWLCCLWKYFLLATDKWNCGCLQTYSGLFLSGLEKLHQLTSSAPVPYELRVDLRTHNESAYAVYDLFQVGSSRERYKLSVGKYRGTAGKENVIWLAVSCVDAGHRSSETSFTGWS